MERFYKGKVALVTGASSGIGRALAVDLVEAGCQVVLVARNKERLKEMADGLDPGKTMILSVDVTDNSEVTNMVELVMERIGKIDILINSAGIFKADSLNSLGLESIKQVMDINYMGTVNCIKAVLPHMEKNDESNIVVLSSLAGRLAIPGCAAYSASKSALFGLANTIRPELRRRGIYLTAVYPSFVDSPLVDEHLDSLKESSFFRMTRSYSPQKVSLAVIKAIKKKKRELILPRMLFPLPFLYELFPGLMDSVMGGFLGGWPDPFA